MGQQVAELSSNKSQHWLGAGHVAFSNKDQVLLTVLRAHKHCLILTVPRGSAAAKLLYRLPALALQTASLACLLLTNQGWLNGYRWEDERKPIQQADERAADEIVTTTHQSNQGFQGAPWNHEIWVSSFLFLCVPSRPQVRICTGWLHRHLC